MTGIRGNFLEGGTLEGGPTVKAAAGAVPMTQQQRDADKRAVQREKARATAARNEQYRADRRAEAKWQREYHARMMADPGSQGQLYRQREKFIASAGLDTGQITMGAKVIAIGASIIASGGAAAGAVGLTGAGASLATAAAADRLVAAVEKGGELGKKAKAVVDDAKAAAAKGNAIAREVVSTVERVAGDRTLSGVAAGVVRPLSAAGEKALADVSAVAATRPTFVFNAPLSSSALRPVSSAPAGAVALSTLRLPTVRPRWLVTNAGKVVDLDRSKASAALSGLIVWSTGKVVKQ